MAAIVTDQFRILNANNFVETVDDSTNSYYITLGLANPALAVGFGRTTSWNTDTPNPVDNFNYINHSGDTTIFGKKVTSANIRRLITRRNWTQGTRYEMYRHDYSVTNPSPVTNATRLYDSSYYVINKNFDVYVCIDNGSSGISSTGNASQDEPLFTDLEPSRAGESGDGYIWKYLFTVPPSDIIKFDSTEYIVVPNNWSTSTNSQIQNVREAADSDVNFNQIKEVYIENPGAGYNNGTYSVDILGDGTGAKASVQTVGGIIQTVTVTAGGSGYTYGILDLSLLQPTGTSPSTFAKLIPIIPPSRGHGYDVYKELGADRVLIYARFDDSTRDFPTDTTFSEVGLIKNPSTFSSKNTIFTGSQYSSLGAIKFGSSFDGSSISIGSSITQARSDGNVARAYVASFDKQTNVLKYYQDRSLYFGNNVDQTDYIGVSTDSKVLGFEATTNSISFAAGGPSDTSPSIAFTGNTYSDGNKEIDLGVYFTGGLADPEINKTTGDVIYIDNRKSVTRDSRQKEDIKIILEF